MPNNSQYNSGTNQLSFTGTMAEQLPIWPESVRGGPNALLRSALFAGIHSKKRVFLGQQTQPEKEPEGVMIAAQDGVTIRYTGTQLNQYDADVFFEAVHRARKEPLGSKCVFTGAAFLKAIGRSRNDLNYEDLNESLRRLRRGTLIAQWTINGRKYEYEGSLIAEVTRAEKEKFYELTFTKKIAILFQAASWTQLEWEERKALKGKPLAQWLHSYFSTHAAPFPISAAYLHEKSGSPTKLLKHFKPELRRALNQLHDSLGWEFTWDDNNLISVTRPPTAAQARHLERKKAKAARQKQEKAAAIVRKNQGQLTSIANILPGLAFGARTR